MKCAQPSLCTATSAAPGKARAVSSASLTLMVRWNGPRVRAAPVNMSTTAGRKRRATSATPS
ncbi:hypothetical protein PSR1_03872 [Anaeromyxobacter sp. PSR-1]|nr:hypothetical protein PSR1_03872 [Anaeromyxobacter sp. PSR-1]